MGRTLRELRAGGKALNIHLPAVYADQPYTPGALHAADPDAIVPQTLSRARQDPWANAPGLRQDEREGRHLLVMEHLDGFKSLSNLLKLGGLERIEPEDWQGFLDFLGGIQSAGQSFADFDNLHNIRVRQDWDEDYREFRTQFAFIDAERGSSDWDPKRLMNDIRTDPRAKRAGATFDQDAAAAGSGQARPDRRLGAGLRLRAGRGALEPLSAAGRRLASAGGPC